MQIKIPELSLVMLVGASSSGKSTFARKHFDQHEIVSSDECRAIVSNDESDMSATDDAFELLHYIVGKRLKRGLLTVVDATNVQSASRKSLIALARQYHALPVAIVLDLPIAELESRNAARPDRQLPRRVLRHQRTQLKQSMRKIKREGLRGLHVLDSSQAVDAVTGIEREPLYNNRKSVHGPFDIIGDVHGCYDELVALLRKLGYTIDILPDDGANLGYSVTPPEGRQAVFVGDLVDRGPNSPGVLRLVMSMVRSGAAWCVPGNHDAKLLKYLDGKKVKLSHGLAETVEQLAGESDDFKRQLRKFLYGLISHYVFDDGKLVVAHAGLREDMQGRGSGAVRSYCLYGETTGETDQFGLPVRYNWATDYRGRAKVVYGHTPVRQAVWYNNTIDIDTGCVFGHELTALRYPEEEIVAVPAARVYCEPSKPMPQAMDPALSGTPDDKGHLLSLADVTGKRIVQTRLRNNITLREEHSIAALEIMSRFAIDPRWLIYLPPTMSPCETSSVPGYLEHPDEAIEYYRKRGVARLVCQEKHMGSRAIVIVCKDEDVAARRFGMADDGIGVIYTRTGRSFFKQRATEQQLLQRVRQAMHDTDFWGRMQTDWVCLDTELMPWSAKAKALLTTQYAAVGSSARHALSATEAALQQAATRGIAATEQLDKVRAQSQAIDRFTAAYRHYCWEVESLDDYRLAPFHVLATEGVAHVDRNHEWHMQLIASICTPEEPILMLTAYRIVDVHDPESVAAARDWWLALTENGGEGMVVKPYDFLTYRKEGLLQPAIKCRGRAYLRIIYGPDYDTPDHLARLRKRGLGRKRSLALRELALGVEGLERFVNGESLRRVHEPVFGVLALESERVDPRL